MQGLTDAPRDGLTESAVRALLTGPALDVRAGLELLDTDDAFVADISDDLLDGEVERQNYADVHATIRLTVSRELAWGRDRVRPYVVLSDGTSEARFYLGVFVLTTPERVIGESPETYDVSGFDKLHLLQSPVGDTYTVPAGTDYLAAVAQVIADAGAGGAVRLDGEAAGKMLPVDAVWPLTGGSDDATWLKIVNDLLAAIGYSGVWADQDGAFRSGPYREPATRAVEWTFDVSDSRTNIVGQDRTLTADVWGAPNRWVFIQQNRQTAPTEGDGRYTVTNQSTGPSSIDALGRTVSKVQTLDAADQTALVAQGDRVVANDLRIVETVKLTTGPLPIAGHFDVATYSDTAAGGRRKLLARSWSLPLSGGDMSWEWETVS